MGNEKSLKKYGLIGKDISYSFSKKYFINKFEVENINASYQNFDLKNVEEFAALKNEKNIFGLNVTIPYKTKIIKYLDDIDKVAEKINAVNTIKIIDGKFIGYNTDVIGFEQTLAPMLQKHHKKAIILGTGGASKAVNFVLNNLKIDVSFASRTATKNYFTYDDLDEKIIEAHLIIINTTPLGTFPNIKSKANIPYQFLTKKHILYDLVYNPNTTAFLKAGIEKKCSVKNGFEMLEKQAEASYKIWTE